MTDVIAAAPKPRNIDIDSAIGHSSFQLPVFVALGAEGGEAQIVKTFATAREVFDHVFSVMLDRLGQRDAIRKVVKLVPPSAHVKTSTNTDYVLIVRGRAIFWFGGAAAKRAAARRLLIEHARQLADAEQALFYKLGTRARKRRAAVIAVGLVLSAGLAVLGSGLARHGALHVQRPAARQAVLPYNSPPNARNWHLAVGENTKGMPPPSPRPIPDSGVPVSIPAAQDVVPAPATAIVTQSPRAFTISAWLRDAIRTAQAVYPWRTQTFDHPATLRDAHARIGPVNASEAVRTAMSKPIARTRPLAVGAPTLGRAQRDAPKTAPR